MTLQILVVEDEALVADDLQRTLTGLGYAVPNTVASGQAAIDVARECRPALVLMDIKLKGPMDGIEAAHCIKQELKIPVIFLTSHSDEATLARAKEVSPQGYLLKPFDDRELRTAIEVGVHNHSLESENARLYRVAQQAIRARDSVLQVVAHELRNPLNSLLLAAEGLLRREGTERRDVEPVRKIRAAVWRMNRQIHDLLDVTSLDAGEPMSLRKTRVPVGTVVTTVVEGQGQTAAKASISLRQEFSATLPEVWADAVRLEQVFENLIGNAIKFTPPGGTIVVGGSPRDGAVLLFVRDSGIGVAPEEISHLFDRFWQADRADRRGSGLGLAIVKGIVESLGGRVWVESTLGHGTTFFMTLPVASTSDEQAAPGPAEVPTPLLSDLSPRG
jgi:signal transduction histidine kinase